MLKNEKRDVVRIKPKQLGNDDKIYISRMMQIFSLEALARGASPTPEMLVFHGGTGVSLIHESPRWSEDLDFMATPVMAGKLLKVRESIERDLRLKMSAMVPGSKITLQDKTPDFFANPEIGNVARWLLRWEHPSFVGAIKIKLEFYLCPEERLSAYGSLQAFPSAPECRSSVDLPAAQLVSVWADKIVAMASRHMLKYRDLHDLGYISPLLDGLSLTEDDRDRALSASMGIYGRTAASIVEGLNRPLVAEGIADRVAWEADMQKWFAGKSFDKMVAEKHLDRLLVGFHKEFDIGLQSVARLLERELETDRPEW